MSTEHFAVSAHTRRDVAVLELKGELDIAVIDLLADAIAEQMSNGHDHLVLDVADLRYVDSTGISVFVRSSTRLYERGGWLRLENVGPEVRQVLTLTGVYDLLTDRTRFAESSWSIDGHHEIDT